MKSTPKRGARVTTKAVAKAKRYYGYFALLVTIETMDAVTALELQRSNGVVEKAFGNLKERLNMRRTLVTSEHSFNGKLFELFVEFVVLIYLSYIKCRMSV